jgi:hypothetical protein
MSALALLALLSSSPEGAAQPKPPSGDASRVLVSRFVVTGVSSFPQDRVQARRGRGQYAALSDDGDGAALLEWRLALAPVSVGARNALCKPAPTPSERE